MFTRNVSYKVYPQALNQEYHARLATDKAGAINYLEENLAKIDKNTSSDLYCPASLSMKL